MWESPQVLLSPVEENNRDILNFLGFLRRTENRGSVLDFALPALKVARFIGVPER